MMLASQTTNPSLPTKIIITTSQSSPSRQQSAFLTPSDKSASSYARNPHPQTSLHENNHAVFSHRSRHHLIHGMVLRQAGA